MTGRKQVPTSIEGRHDKERNTHVQYDQDTDIGRQLQCGTDVYLIFLTHNMGVEMYSQNENNFQVQKMHY